MVLPVDQVFDDPVFIWIDLFSKILTVQFLDDITHRWYGNEFAPVEKFAEQSGLVVLSLDPDGAEGKTIFPPELPLERPVIVAVRMVHGEDNRLIQGNPLEIFHGDIDVGKKPVIACEKQRPDNALAPGFALKADFIIMLKVDHIHTPGTERPSRRRSFSFLSHFIFEPRIVNKKRKKHFHDEDIFLLPE
jgi:hypothetical protein